MTFPAAAGGLQQTPWAVTGTDGSLPAMGGSTQDAVTSQLKNNLLNSPNWSNLGNMFQGAVKGSGLELMSQFVSTVAHIDIDILGINIEPFAFLQGWADQLAAQGQQALSAAAAAQSSADTANASIGTVSTGVTANVTGSIASDNPSDVGPAVQLLNATIQATGGAPQVDVFNQSATWTQASGAKTVDIMAVASGGGGAQGGMGSTGAAGGSGGAGGYSIWPGITASSLPSTCPVVVPFGGVGGQNPGTMFRDDFNRTDNTNLGSNWRVDSGSASAQILSDGVEAGPMLSEEGENGRWCSWATGELVTDDYIVQAQLRTPVTPEASDDFTGVYLAVPTGTWGSSTLVVVFAGNLSGGCGLFTQAGPPPGPYVANGGGTGQTIVANSTTPFSNTSLIALSRIGNVFTGYIDGAEVVTWTDSGNTILTGAGNRGFGFACEGNYPAFQNQFNSPAIDWIQARDIGVNSQPGGDGGTASFNGSTYQATGGTGGVGGGIDPTGTRRPASGSFLNTAAAWSGAQGSGNQAVNASGGAGAAGQSGYTPDGEAGGAGYNTAGGAAGTASSLDGQSGTPPTAAYGPGSGGGGGYYLPLGSVGQAGSGGAGGFPGGGGGGGGATLDGQGANGPGQPGGDGQVVVTTHFT